MDCGLAKQWIFPRTLILCSITALIVSCSGAKLPPQVGSAVPSFKQFIEELTPESADESLANLVGDTSQSEQRDRISGQLVALMEVVGRPDQVEYLGAYVLGDDPGIVEVRFVSFHPTAPVAWKFRLYLVGSRVTIVAVEFATDDLPRQYGRWVPRNR